MKILYIGVHNQETWRAEYWLSKAFTNLGHEIIKYDYKSNRKKIKSWSSIGKEISQIESHLQPDVILLQRGKNMSTSAIKILKTPIFFWSTEPLKLKKDVDKLLKSDIYSWVFVHSYSCIDRIKSEFHYLVKKSSVMHNACPKDIIKYDTEKSNFAIFNRNISNRRKKWLQPSEDLIQIVKGKFGDEYFNDLKRAHISVNIHYSDKNLDDFETGIFESMACGCVVVSETLYEQTLNDINAKNAIIQVGSPKELKEKLKLLKSNPDIIIDYVNRSIKVIQQNTWHERANLFLKKFNEYI